MKGVTIPVKLSGPFTSPDWKIDFSGIVADVAKQKVEEHKEKLKEKVTEQLKDKLKGLFGR